MSDHPIPFDSEDVKTVPQGLEPPRAPEQDAATKFAEIVGNMLDDKLRPVLANQDLTLGEVRELSSRVGTIEKRMHIGEGRFERIEAEIKGLRERIAVLEKSLTDDGK